MLKSKSDLWQGVECSDLMRLSVSSLMPLERLELVRLASLLLLVCSWTLRSWLNSLCRRGDTDDSTNLWPEKPTEPQMKMTSVMVESWGQLEVSGSREVLSPGSASAGPQRRWRGPRGTGAVTAWGDRTAPETCQIVRHCLSSDTLTQTHRRDMSHVSQREDKTKNFPPVNEV